jgi:hypothetical protein
MALSIPGVTLGAVLRQDLLGEWIAAESPDGARTVRTLRAEHVSREDARLLFAEELRRIATLPKAWFLAVERSDARAERPWMLTESVTAPDLEHVLAEQGPLPPDDALALARTAAGSFVALAERRQVHAAPIPAQLLRLGRGWVWTTFRDIRASDECSALKGRKPADARYAPPETDATPPEPLRAGPWRAWAVGALLRASLGLGPPCDPGGKPRAPTDPAPAALGVLLTRLLDPAPRLRIPDAASALVLLERGTSAVGPAAPTHAPAAPRPAAPIPTKRPRAR